MQCPDDFPATFFQILKQNSDIQIISVNIMQMNDIGIKLLDFLYQLSRRPCGITSVTIGNAADASMNIDIHVCTYTVSGIALRRLLSSIGNHTRIAFFRQHIIKPRHDSAGAACPTYGVDE